MNNQNIEKSLWDVSELEKDFFVLRCKNESSKILIKKHNTNIDHIQFHFCLKGQLDFMYNNQCDILVWLNPISPLQTGQEIMDVVRYFIDNNLNSLITVIDRQAHCVMDQKPINFSIEEKFKITKLCILIISFL